MRKQTSNLKRISACKGINFTKSLILAIYCLIIMSATKGVAVENSLLNSVDVSMYKVFELSLINETAYHNKFIDVELTATYTSPSEQNYEFLGFYDGDGNGGGDYQNGNVWKIRFMPNETGQWTYEYTWSDESQSGRSILQPYEKNKNWFAYNGTDPVWLKSYYETGHGSIGQNFEWIVENVYSKFINTGYNHLRTYEDEMPKENEYDRPEYTFAAVENHVNLTNDRDLRHFEQHLYKEPWTHHLACLVGYKGKPVFMSEGNALWRRFW